MIERLGRKGEGVALVEDRSVFVPYALPGERVRAEHAGDRAFLGAVLEASPDRVAPPCPYFGRCGGCAIQHIAHQPYRAWKRGLVEAGLARAGLPRVVAPLIDAHGAGRRRLTLHVRNEGRGASAATRAGFMAARTHDLVDIESCPISVAALGRAPSIARALGAALRNGGKPLDAQFTATDGGLDVDLRGNGPPQEPERLALAALATSLDLARLTVHGAPLLERRTPAVRMGRADVVLNAGSFLQATASGEAALADLVREAIGPARKVADLFCGVGPFALRMAESAAVTAADSNASALEALIAATRRTQGLKPIVAERRDLFRQPMPAKALSAFDAVTFDPPRAGAEAQSREIARSAVPIVVAVSCDVQSFARDATILIAGGYRLERVTPVDQFLYSPHVELVGVFRR